MYKEYWKSFTSYPLKSCRSIEESWLKIDDGWEERGGSLDFLSSAKWKNTRWTTRWKLMETRSSAWNCLINEYFRIEPARVAICGRKSSCSFIRLVNFACDGPWTKRNNRESGSVLKFEQCVAIRLCANRERRVKYNLAAVCTDTIWYLNVS